MDRRERRRRQRELKKIEEKVRKATSQLRTANIGSGRSPGWVRRYFGQTISITRMTFGLVSVVLAIFGAWIYVRPQISVEPYTTLDPSDPFSVKFKIANESISAMLDVNGIYLVNYMKIGRSTWTHGVLERGKGHLGDRIAYKESATLDCPISGVTSDSLSEADISIAVEYRPEWWLWRTKKQQRFVGTRGATNIYHWLPRPLSD